MIRFGFVSRLTNAVSHPRFTLDAYLRIAFLQVLTELRIFAFISGIVRVIGRGEV
jgi:hypothetical protein